MKVPRHKILGTKEFKVRQLAYARGTKYESKTFKELLKKILKDEKQRG